MNLIVKYHELLPYLIISNFQTLTSFFRCTVSEYAEYTNAKYKMSFVHWRLTLFIKSLTPHCQDANQAHSNMEWENVLFFFLGKSAFLKVPIRLPGVCRVARRSRNYCMRLWMQDSSTTSVYQLFPANVGLGRKLFWRLGNWHFGIWCLCSVDACSFSPAV